MSWGHLDVWGELASYMYNVPPPQFSRLGMYVCLSGLVGLLHLSTLLKLVCYAHVHAFPCTCTCIHVNNYSIHHYMHMYM